MEIIAEIGQNHNGELSLAKELIKSAKEAGADVAKFQAYDAKILFPQSNNPWYEYNCQTELSYDQLEELASFAKEVKIEFMASAFDTDRVKWLESLGVKRHKLASRSIYDHDLINALANTRKPLIASLGMWQKERFPFLAGTMFLFFIAYANPTPHHELHLAKIDFQKYSGFVAIPKE